MLYKQMRCFLEVANTLNFTTAANNLYMSQQAVTKQISSLEADLGIRLFDRTTRSVELTTSGKILRDDFTSIHAKIEESIRRAKSTESGARAAISVGFLSALSRKSIVVPITDLLLKDYPEIYFDIKLLDFTELRNQLFDNKLDLIVTTSTDWKLWPKVDTAILASKKFEIVYSQKHELAQKAEFAEEDLKDYVQLTLPKENLFPGSSFWGQNMPCRDTIPCPDIATLLIRLESGQGFSLLTRVFDGFESETLRYREVSSPEAHGELICICRNDADESTKKAMRTIHHFTMEE